MTVEEWGVEATTPSAHPLGWMVYECRDHEETHVIPMNDLREHVEEETCWCNPRYGGEQNDHELWVHASFDNREETYEKGKVN
jgi:hypothetical protein